MLGWNKIAALFALSLSAGLMGAACSMEVKETADAPEAEDESTAVETLASPNLDPLRGGASFERRRCENVCLDRFSRCGRGPGTPRSRRERDRFCLQDRDRCMRGCWRL